ncbi:MAG: hypothetical protein ACLR2E_06880 [Lachnospiraceae bacterium]
MLLAGGWLGFAFGVVVSLSVLKFGFFGLGVGLLLTIPRGFSMWPGLLSCFRVWRTGSGILLTGWLFREKAYDRDGLFLLGILTESFVSLWNLRLLLSDLKEKRKI